MDSLGIPTLSQAQQSPPAILGALTTIRVYFRYSLTLLRSSQGISLKITPTLLFFLSLPLSLHTHTHIYIYTYTHTYIYMHMHRQVSVVAVLSICVIVLFCFVADRLSLGRFLGVRSRRRARRSLLLGAFLIRIDF